MRLDEPESLPLTAAQESIWLGQLLDPASSMFNAAEYLRIEAPLDVALFDQALHQAVAEADILHVRFEMDQTAWPRQIFGPPRAWRLQVFDLTANSEPESTACRMMRADLAKAVDLLRDAVFTHMLFRLPDAAFIWYHRCHHIALDGYSFALIAARVAALYGQLASGDSSNSSSFGSLRAVLAEDLAYRASAQYTTDRAFWTTHLANRTSLASLSTRFAPPSPSPIRAGATLACGTAKKWSEFTRRVGGSWVDLVIAVVALHLLRKSRSGEVVLGLPVMGRLGSAAARTPMMVTNLVPLRLTALRDTGLPEAVHAVGEEIRRVRPHWRYRGEQMRRDLASTNGPTQLFGPIVNVIPFDYGFTFAGRRAIATNLSTGAPFIDDMAVQLHVRHDSAPVELDVDFNPDRYDASEAARHTADLAGALCDTDWMYRHGSESSDE